MPVLWTLKYRTDTTADALAVIETALAQGWELSNEAPMLTRDAPEVRNGNVVSRPPWVVHPAVVQRVFDDDETANDAWNALDDAVFELLGSVDSAGFREPVSWPAPQPTP